MVDALQECRRVLEPGGILVDLRPFHSNPALEILVGEAHYVPGYIDDQAGAADDIAADEALADAVGSGYFEITARDSFVYADYWDSLDGMLDYSAEYWREFVHIPPAVVLSARRAAAGGNYQVRVRRPLHIAVLSKRI